MLKIKIDGVVSAENIHDYIPDDVEELELECAEVAGRAFYNNRKLRTLRLVNVAKIGERAFSGTELETAELVNCRELGTFSFANNKKLLELRVEGAEIIGNRAFSTCSNLRSLELEGCETTGYGSFKQCRGLKTVRLNCRVIGELAFRECGGINSMTLENVETIERYAFSHTFIKEFNLPEPIPELLYHAFELATVRTWNFAPSDDADWLKIKTDGVLSEEDIPFNVKYLEIECKEIPMRALYKHKFLQRIRLKNVEKIGDFAFAHCSKLLFAELENCGELGEGAFEISGLLKLTLDNVKKIGKRAFYSCKRLAGVKLSGGDEICEEAFADCTHFIHAKLDCREIGEKAFCESTVSVLELERTEVIGASAFEECKGLYEIKLPETLREIKSRAFYETRIFDCVIPRSVRRLGARMFNKLGTNTLEVYQSADGKFPKFVYGEPWDTTIIVRSAQTDEILFEYLTGSNCDVLTEHGADFTKYDNSLLSFRTTWDDRSRIKAADLRLKFPYGLSEETRGVLAEICAKTAAYELDAMIRQQLCPWNFTHLKFYDDIKLPVFLTIIAHAIEGNRDEQVNELLKVLLKKLCESNEILNRGQLMTVLDYSTKNGFTELSAVILQKLNETRGGSSNFDL